MYLIPNMIYMGLKEGEEFKSEAHKTVAQNICLCNPNVNTIDLLQEIVEIINSIPEDKIKQVTYNDLVKDYNIPDIGIYVS